MPSWQRQKWLRKGEVHQSYRQLTFEDTSPPAPDPIAIRSYSGCGASSIDVTKLRGWTSFRSLTLCSSRGQISSSSFASFAWSSLPSTHSVEDDILMLVSILVAMLLFLLLLILRNAFAVWSAECESIKTNSASSRLLRFLNLCSILALCVFLVLRRDGGHRGLAFGLNTSTKQWELRRETSNFVSFSWKRFFVEAGLLRFDSLWRNYFLF